MATISPEEVERLQQQLKERTREVKEIYDKLVEVGAVPLPDDFLDEVAGGGLPSLPPINSVADNYVRPDDGC